MIGGISVRIVLALVVVLAWPRTTDASLPNGGRESTERQASVSRTAIVSGPNGERQMAERQASVAERLVEIRIHGNVTVSDEEILRIARIAAGDPFGDDTLALVERRLKDSGRFDVVEIRKRYRSLDMTDVALVLLVHEPPGPAGGNPLVRPMVRMVTQSMFLPVLNFEEGYGFTYGARVSTVDWLHGRERISVPLTWGATRRAAVEIERAFRTGPIARVSGHVGVWTRENPHYEIDDTRVEFKARVEHAIARPLHAGVELGRADVDFGALDQRYWSYGADVTLDTRGDPTFPGNAVFLSAGWSSLDIDGADRAIKRYRGDARGFVRLKGQSVVGVRALYEGADRPLPPYERSLLGGMSTLRGHGAGEFAGDRMLVTSVEIRAPLTSPMGIGKAGVRIFYDSGVAWNVEQRRQDLPFQQGAGAGVFIAAPLFRINLDAAANLSGGGGRVHFTAGFSF